MKSRLQRWFSRLGAMGLGRSGSVKLIKVLRRLRSMGVWFLAGSVLFLLFAWLSFPSDMLAWRISHECKKRGYVVDVGSASLSPFGGITLEDVGWTFAPSRPGEPPSTFVIEELDVSVGLLSYMFGTIDVDVEGIVDDGRFEGAYVKSEEESSFNFKVEDLPLYAVPKARQALNVPLLGVFELEVDMKMPNNEFAKAEGHIEINCESCRMGDGETLLFIPGSKGLMAKGVTIPEIDLGTLAGRMNIVDGLATTDGDMKAESDDMTLAISGTIDFNDPFAKSEVDLIMKLVVTKALQDRSDAIGLMVQTASSKTKLKAPEKGLGYRLTGTVGQTKFRGIYSKTREERLRERREKARERQKEARKRKAERDAEKAKKKKEAAKKKEEEKKEEEKKEEDEPIIEIEEKPADAEEQPVIGQGVRVEPVGSPTQGEPAGEPAESTDQPEQPEQPEQPAEQPEAGGEEEGGGTGGQAGTDTAEAGDDATPPVK